MLKIAVLVSGGGTNLQALIDSQHRGDIANGSIACVISNNENAGGLVRAQKADIATRVCRRKDYPSEEAYDEALVSIFNEFKIDLIVLAGYLAILSKSVTDKYANKIINIHPALIPSFCGKGYYGLKVHEAVLAAGVKVTGATVHFVNEVPDGGAIIAQKAVDVLPDDTPESLQLRVMQQAEWVLLPYVVAQYCLGNISVVGNRAVISNAK